MFQFVRTLYSMFYMSLYHKRSFAKQLTFYLLTALVMTFGLIFITMFTSLKQFVNNTAYTQARIIADNSLLTFRHQMKNIELLASSILDLNEKTGNKNPEISPERILTSYSMLSGCSVHHDTKNCRAAGKRHLCAKRMKDGTIVKSTPPECYDYFPDTLTPRTPKNGYWKSDKKNSERTLSYCCPIHNKDGKACGILQLYFFNRTITKLICDYKLFNSGYLFITDQQGNFINHPDSNVLKKGNIRTFFEHPKINYSGIIHKFISGETGYCDIIKNNTQYYFYFTRIPEMNWRLGIISPYSEIMPSTNKLYVFLFICFSLGLIFLFGCIIRIVRRFSSPLKELAMTARQIAEGQFDTKLSYPTLNNEIQELYASFRYMQQNIADYIEQLKTNTAEKELIHWEMQLAQKIQQRFLPHRIDMPPTIELYADLRQSKEVGGDLYEYFIIDNRIYFAIGDVSGYGTPAALYMASIIKFFRYVASGKTSTAEICNIINSHMCDNMDDMYITMFMGIMDIKTGTVTFTNAGHPYPLLLHKDNTISLLNKFPDIPIGILEDYIYTEHVYTLEQNTQLILYTDGITDAENINGEFYGKDKMRECINRTAVKNPANIVNAILDDINCHIYDIHQSDDLTILSLLYKGEEKVKNKD